MAKKKDGDATQNELIETSSKYPLDDKDKELINVLLNHGRMTNIEIAEKLGTSEATVRRRIDNLVNQGIIRGFAALVDNKQLGNSLKASLHLKVDSRDIDSLARLILDSKHACSLYKVIGRYNVYTEMVFSNIQSFQRFIDMISENEKIDDFEYHIVTHAYKPCPWSGL